jgi:tetratricopeptide (TPR) repeat protein
VTLGLWLLNCSRLGAGLYNTAEPAKGPRPSLAANSSVEALGFTQFRDLLTDLSKIGNELQESAGRKHYLAQRDEMLAKYRNRTLTTQEKVNLSEYLIRLREYEKAVELLTPLAAQERRNFMVYANLATAHQLAGRLDPASSYLEHVKTIWPKEWPGLTSEQLTWYQRAEKYHLRLLRLRYRESLRAAASRSKAPETLDELFADDKGAVRFVGDSGAYEAGKMAAKERAKLPEDALAVVQQLLVWIPGPAPGMEDPRLFWLLGELYNAAGDVEAASEIFQSLVWSYRYDAPELREHRKILQAAMPEPVVIGAAETPLPAPRPSWLPELRQNLYKIVLVGVVVALVVVGLVYLQIRELRRRRKSLG